MRSIRHNNIVFFFGWGMMQDMPFLVAEYMRRGSVKVRPASLRHLSDLELLSSCLTIRL